MDGLQAHTYTDDLSAVQVVAYRPYLWCSLNLGTLLPRLLTVCTCSLLHSGALLHAVRNIDRCATLVD